MSHKLKVFYSQHSNAKQPVDRRWLEQMLDSPLVVLLLSLLAYRYNLPKPVSSSKFARACFVCALIAYECYIAATIL